MSMTIIMFGPPMAGKGTQARRIAQRFDLELLATGDIIRAESKQDTPRGRTLRADMEAGKNAPDDVVNEAVRDYIQRFPNAVLDGYPRRVSQAEYLVEHAPAQGIVIHLNTTLGACLQRVETRTICSECNSTYGRAVPEEKSGMCDVDGKPLSRRSDDIQETLIQRLADYRVETLPALEVLGQKGFFVYDIKGDMAPDQVTNSIVHHLTMSLD